MLFLTASVPPGSIFVRSANPAPFKDGYEFCSSSAAGHHRHAHILAGRCKFLIEESASDSSLYNDYIVPDEDKQSESACKLDKKTSQYLPCPNYKKKQPVLTSDEKYIFSGPHSSKNDHINEKLHKPPQLRWP